MVNVLAPSKRNGQPIAQRTLNLAKTIAAGESWTRAARHCGIPDDELGAYQRDPEVRRLITRLRGETLDTAQGRLASVLPLAIDKLEDLIGSNDEKISLDAAKTLANVFVRTGSKLADELERANDIAERDQLMSELMDGGDAQTNAEAVKACISGVLTALERTMAKSLPPEKCSAIMAEVWQSCRLSAQKAVIERARPPLNDAE